MSDQTSLLELPYILPSQAQKHVTHNEALRRLDAVVQLSVANRTLTAPPADPAEGDRHIVAAGATGGWSGKDDQIAAFQDGAWAFLIPRAGWLAWVADEAELVCRDGTTWRLIEDTLSQLQNMSLLGVGTTANTANPFAAKLNKALWSARYASEGGDGDLRYTFNKEASGNSASLLMQTNWSGRAEIGLTGDDNLHIKVSADGSAWRESILADATTGSVGFPSGLVHAASGAPLNGVLFTPGGDGTVSIWRLDTSHAQNPRSATISSISGDLIMLATTTTSLFFSNVMAGVSYVRIWNASKSPAQSAWLKAIPNAATLQVVEAASVIGWTSGETVQIGDPTDMTSGRVIALDISPMLENLFGTAFPQAGIMVKSSIQGSVGDTLSLSPSGISGSFTSCARTDSGDGVSVIACTEQSPISNTNLVFLRENITTTATIEIASCVAVFV